MLVGNGGQGRFGGGSLGVNQIHDHALMRADDSSVRLGNEVAHRGGVPVISTSHSAGIIHALLHYRPFAAAAHDERMQIKLESVCNGIVVDARRKPAGAHQRVTVEASLAGNGAKFVRGSARVLAPPAANIE